MHVQKSYLPILTQGKNTPMVGQTAEKIRKEVIQRNEDTHYTHIYHITSSSLATEH